MLTSFQDFAAAQAKYYASCSEQLKQLQKELGSLSLQVSTSDLALSISSPTSPGAAERRQARVLCDYDSQDATELSLIAGEVCLPRLYPVVFAAKIIPFQVIDVLNTIANDPDYVQAERGHKSGRVPISYLQFID